ncbi:MAG: histidine--tRNA ligase [Nanoarchaeota archaeon]
MVHQKPKGTVDLFPDEKKIQNLVFNSLRKTAENFGFFEVDPPVIESLGLLEAKQGEEIKSQIFTTEKKGDENIALRAEFTPSLARMFISKQKELPKPVKWFALNKVWRYERPQSGRDREFFQFNCEIFGSGNPESDAEMISLAIESLCSLGLKESQFKLKINNRKLLEGIVSDFTDKITEVIKVIDKKNKISGSVFLDMLKETGVKNSSKLKTILETEDIKKFEKLKLNSLAKDGLLELKNILSLVDSPCITFSPSTARGLAYYTGTVFEIFDKDEKLRSIAGGGRYDNMIAQFQGIASPATGFGMGYSTLKLLLEQNGLLPKIDLGPDYYIAVVDKTVLRQAMEVANKLRKKYVVSIDLMGRNLGNQFKYANAINAKNVIVFGPDEFQQGKLKIKNMETGDERTVGIRDILS